MNLGSSVPSRYFVDLYREHTDPWNFATSEYESQKYRATLDALPQAQYRSACELGCSIGVFTEMLAMRCERLLAVDVSEAALQRARERCAIRPQVRFACMDLLAGYPEGRYDLTTVCEIGFYFSQKDLGALCRNVVRCSLPGATVVLVHWTPKTPGHALSTDAVHGHFLREPRLRHLSGFERETYRLDVLERRP
jgi:SAM-dependent methyltransferase